MTKRKTSEDRKVIMMEEAISVRFVINLIFPTQLYILI